MRIGLAYDLRTEYLALGYSEEQTAEFDKEETLDALEAALRDLGFIAERIGHVYNCVEALSRGKRWDMVFNITEGLFGLAREAQVPALLDAYRIPYVFSDPFVLTVSLHKPTAKLMASRAGVPTPEFRVVGAVDEIGMVDLAFPLFAKPIAEGTSKGINEQSVIRSRSELVSTCSRLLAEYAQPVLVETFLPGREVTVGILGTGGSARAAGVLEFSLRAAQPDTIYSYENKERCEELVDYSLVTGDFADEASRMALAVWNGFGCRDAGRVDLRADAQGRLHFIELNPLAGLHPTHSDLPIIWSLAGGKYRDLIRHIMESALPRVERCSGHAFTMSPAIHDTIR